MVLVHVFTLDKADEHTFLGAWMDDAMLMKRQPGFISTQLHRAIGESPTSRVQGKTLALPSSAVASPHLFQKVTAPGICVE
jgi:hypothetical protein